MNRHNNSALARHRKMPNLTASYKLQSYSRLLTYKRLRKGLKCIGDRFAPSSVASGGGAFIAHWIIQISWLSVCPFVGCSLKQETLLAFGRAGFSKNADRCQFE